VTATRQRRPVVLLRPVPGTSFIHELWAGTKLIVVFAVSLLLSFYPGWIAIALMAVLVAAAMWLADIPRGVLPSIPRWLLKFLRFTALSIVLLALGAMVSWTTNVADVAPAVATLGRPLKWIRFPVEDWAVALGLALRAFPMLLDEFRLLFAARRLRPKPVLPEGQRRRHRWFADLVDLLAAGVTVALRRADEMGDAITARGGTGQISAVPSRPGAKDWLVLAIVAAVCAAAIVMEMRGLGGS
jgi:energy-coupling factor transport system permease protein